MVKKKRKRKEKKMNIICYINNIILFTEDICSE